MDQGQVIKLQVILTTQSSNRLFLFFSIKQPTALISRLICHTHTKQKYRHYPGRTEFPLDKNKATRTELVSISIEEEPIKLRKKNRVIAFHSTRKRNYKKQEQRFHQSEKKRSIDIIEEEQSFHQTRRKQLTGSYQAISNHAASHSSHQTRRQPQQEVREEEPIKLRKQPDNEPQWASFILHQF